MDPVVDDPAAGRKRLSLSGAARVWALAAGLAGASVFVYVMWVRDLPTLESPVHVPWWALIGVYFAAEVMVVHLQIRREAYTFSLGEIPLVLGLYFVSPNELLLAAVVGIGGALAIHRRQSILKLVFNLSHFSLEVGLAATVFHMLVSADAAISPRGWLVVFFVTFMTAVIGNLAIGAAISLSERTLHLENVTQGLGMGLATTATNTGLALVGVRIMWADARAAWLLAIPAMALFLAYRAYSSQRQKRESIELLYRATRLGERSLKMESVMLSLLEQAREMFKAEIAEITLFPRDDHPAERTRVGPGEVVVIQEPVSLHPEEGVWARLAAEGEPILLKRPIANERLARYFGDRAIRDCMIAPLRVETDIVGKLLVGNRLGDVSSFDDEDLKLLETLASHASISLENARLVATLEESLEHLQEVNRLKDDFVASVSHELRTPLTSIQGYVKTIRRKLNRLRPDQLASFLQIVDEQSDQLRELIEDLLIVSRLESNEAQASFKEVSLPAVLRDIAREFSSHRGSHDIELSLPDLFPAVETDENKVRQIVSNLVDNAMKYTAEGTPVQLRATTSAERAVITVEDEGPGIPPHLHERIFERFFQADQSITRTTGGTGLGLYICRRLAEVMGAEVKLERSDERGSVFSLTIPFSPATERLPSRDQATA
ncbi:MAG: GAF domain-containing protein [Actinobacteria bacterium]|nr:GAF domain-containing protein [Actinomycetota bacterium]